MLENLPILSLLIWVPIAGAGLIIFATGQKNPQATQWLALLTAAATFALSLVALNGFDYSRVFFGLSVGK
jgi:NADH-quinone oxidoreductase subunit M